MSIGKCQDIDQYLYILRQVLDGESTTEDERYLTKHLDNCSCCLEAYELEKQVRKLLRTRIARRKVPAGLAASIKAKILQAAIHVR
jgi:anti-sigma factor (TIGR02949 family)